MKKYEIIARMKKDILHMQNKFDKWESMLGKEQEQFAVLKLRHQLIEADGAKVLNNIEETKAQIFEYLKVLKQKLRSFTSKRKKPSAPILPPKKKNGNGKKKCDICNKEFASSGYPSHRKKCERIRELEVQLAKEQEEDLQEEVILEVIPEPQIEEEE